LESFENKLLAIGYLNLPEYNEQRYLIESTIYFSVEDQFPMIKASIIPPEIEDLNFSVRIDKCGAFKTGPCWPAIMAAFA
jgi:hypothetical protein